MLVCEIVLNISDQILKRSILKMLQHNYPDMSNGSLCNILFTFHLATLKEFVVVYVRTCVAENEDPTPSGFKFAHKHRHIPNFSYMYDQVCKYSQAIISFRMGTRRNNSQLIWSAKHTFKDVFHGRNHPIYSLIEINNTLLNDVTPQPVQDFLNQNSAFSKSGDKSKGQDTDYILEETNQETKQWIPKGVPEDETWCQVCRNLPHFKSYECQDRGAERCFMLCYV